MIIIESRFILKIRDNQPRRQKELWSSFIKILESEGTVTPSSEEKVPFELTKVLRVRTWKGKLPQQIRVD